MYKLFSFKKILLLILIIISLLMLKYIFNNINDIFCIAENEIIKKATCPNNKYIAIGFIRDAGATTSKSPQVSILKKGEKFTNHNVGNVFIGNHSSFIDIKWENTKTLIIVYKCEEFNVIKKKYLSNNIKIKYNRVEGN
ncbi:DUF5412 family protein [Crassaminicella indica]|uniref:Uncharacterized protein n=1 Tax=Crassaminicella indica TaxID=2855394 RepID=A0ABX8RDJ6_9CLOT|nr:DUF5412 family protein [Crassaminicella indica]QXM07159.1 hypothetical protein KVH43_05520 [Crassaminicella indica]